MKHWLAFDTSSELASFVLKSGDKIFQHSIEGVALHAEQALVHIHSLLDAAKIQVQDLSGILVGRGPGSFTGLRVACALAKGLAFAHQIPLYPVSNLALMAWQAHKLSPHLPILAVMDARMQQVYWAYYPHPLADSEEKVSSISEIVLPAEPWVLASFRLPEDLPFSRFKQGEHGVQMSALTMLNMLEAGALVAVKVEDLEPVYVRDQVTHGSKHG
jgi:tRNA threonylcarbamoyladenosine biosynthesis protein TsaB